MPERASRLRDSFERWCRDSAERVAIAHKGATLTYKELDTATAGVDRLLRARESLVVGIVDRGDIATRVYYLAAMRSGSVIVPIDPEWPQDRIDHVIRTAAVGSVLDSAPVVASEPPYEREPVCGGTLHRRALSAFDDERARNLVEGDILYILFTSGSTGSPKGVPIKEASVLAMLESVREFFDFAEDDRFSATFRLTFDLSVFDILVPLSAGAVSILPESRVEVMHAADYVRGARLTVWFSVPSVIEIAAVLGQLPDDSGRGLRYSLFCGERLSREQATTWLRFSSTSVLGNLYGPTEATIACIGHLEAPGESVAEPDSGSVPIGLPFSSVSVRIGSQRSPEELLLSGAQVFAGYLDPRDDEDAFEWFGDVQWYRTGDRALEAGGRLHHLGRLDRQVKISGHRIELGEIEAAFLRAGAHRAHAAVRERGAQSDVVLYLPADVHGQGLIDTAIALLPAYMRPARIVRVSGFPLSDNGKVDVRALMQSAESQE